MDVKTCGTYSGKKMEPQLDAECNAFGDNRSIYMRNT